MSSATRNENATESVSNQGGEFHASIPRAEPQTTHGHQPGQLVSEADHAPEFHAQTLPAGSAPASKTFEPNPTGDTDTPIKFDNPALAATPSSGPNSTESGTTTSAADTIGGATSADVHTGLGHPGAGQSSQELHDESGGRSGLQGTGAGRAPHAGEVEGGRRDFSTEVEGATNKTTGGQFTPGKSDMA